MASCLHQRNRYLTAIPHEQHDSRSSRVEDFLSCGTQGKHGRLAPGGPGGYLPHSFGICFQVSLNQPKYGFISVVKKTYNPLLGTGGKRFLVISVLLRRIISGLWHKTGLFVSSCFECSGMSCRKHKYIWTKTFIVMEKPRQSLIMMIMTHSIFKQWLITSVTLHTSIRSITV